MYVPGITTAVVIYQLNCIPGTAVPGYKIQATVCRCTAVVY